MIEMAIQMQDGEKKTELTRALANHMKLCYLTWNKDSVTDQLIIQSLKDMSGGLLELPEETVLVEIKEPIHKPNPPKKKRSKGGYKGK